jgi:hypothetical protein
MRAAQARAMLHGLATLGEPAVLQGQPCGHVHVQRNAAIAPGIGDTADDNHVSRVILVSLAAKPSGVDLLLGLAPGTTISHAPRVGQTVVHPTEGTLKLDRMHSDNGVTRTYIAVQL